MAKNIKRRSKRKQFQKIIEIMKLKKVKMWHMQGIKIQEYYIPDKQTKSSLINDNKGRSYSVKN